MTLTLFKPLSFAGRLDFAVILHAQNRPLPDRPTHQITRHSPALETLLRLNGTMISFFFKICEKLAC